MPDSTEERDTMVHALREEPGSYSRSLEDGTEVIYSIYPSDDGFIAGWEHLFESGSAQSSQQEKFSSYADALRHLAQNFDAPLHHQER